jgi:hypothetical protein
MQELPLLLDASAAWLGCMTPSPFNHALKLLTQSVHYVEDAQMLLLKSSVAAILLCILPPVLLVTSHAGLALALPLCVCYPCLDPRPPLTSYNM